MEQKIFLVKKIFLKRIIELHKSTTDYDRNIKSNTSIVRDIETNEQYLKDIKFFRQDLASWEKALKEEIKRLKNMNTTAKKSKKTRKTKSNPDLDMEITEIEAKIRELKHPKKP